MLTMRRKNKIVECSAITRLSIVLFVLLQIVVFIVDLFVIDWLWN